MEALLTSGEAHRAAGAPTAALPYVLAALHHARRLSLDLAAAEAVVALAHIWLALGASPEKGSSAFELGLRPLEPPRRRSRSLMSGWRSVRAPAPFHALLMGLCRRVESL